jgi:mycofactocin precursor
MSTDPRSATTAAPAAAEGEAESPVTAESLIEEVSIDGMCGVY